MDEVLIFLDARPVGILCSSERSHETNMVLCCNGFCTTYYTINVVVNGSNIGISDSLFSKTSSNIKKESLHSETHY
jgi:hypothetical protein